MTAVSTLGQTLDQIERLKTLNLQVATYQTQLASGKKTNVFKGLGVDVVVSERARADFKALDIYSANITVASRRIKMMNSSLEKIKQQAGNIVNAIGIQTQEGEFEIESVGQLAKKTLDFIKNLINQQDGDRYLFGGTDTVNQPLSDTGTLDTYVETQVDRWIASTIDTDQMMDSYRDTTQMTDTIIGYSAQLSGGNAKKVFVRVDQTTEIDYTVFANDPAIRDIVAAAKTLEVLTVKLDKVNLDPDDPPGTVTAPGADTAEQNDNFFAIFNDIAAMITNALDRIDLLQYDVGNVYSQINQIEESYKQDRNVLLSTISDVEDADMNEVAVKLNALQTQLNASYQVTAFVQQLSLVNFLGR